jgi:hypothetical protein
MKQLPQVTRLAFVDEHLRDIAYPRRTLRLTRGLGSGLTHDAEGRLWAVGDRGPNLKVKLAVEEYGLEALKETARPSAKMMPALEIGPAMAELRVEGEHVRLVQVVPLRGNDGRPLSGLPTPASQNSRREPALDEKGNPLAPDAGGVDSEGIAAAPSGGFWIGDEYGPSLLRVGGDGKVAMRWVPQGEAATVAGAPYPTADCLPALAAARHVNRGFEALAISGDGRRLYVAFQSPLAHPDVAAHQGARHVRLWTIDAATGALLAQHAYALEDPASFRRDAEKKGELEPGDVKVSELTCIGDDRLLVLERGSETTKIYRVELTEEGRLPEEHGRVETRPTLEELSASGRFDLPVVTKTLLFDSDHHPEVSADLEGMTLLDERTLLLVNDNDFGIENAETVFWRVELAEKV